MSYSYQTHSPWGFKFLQFGSIFPEKYGEGLGVGPGYVDGEGRDHEVGEKCTVGDGNGVKVGVGKGALGEGVGVGVAEPIVF